MIKRTLKFTLCAGLLAAGASVYADVTLTDGTPKTWAEFVDALNGTINVGTVNNAYNIAVTDAVENYNTAQAKVETDSTNLETAKQKLANLTPERKEELAEAVTTAQNALNASVADTDSTTEGTTAYEVKRLKAQVATLNADIATAEGKIATATADSIKYKDQLRTLPKKTKTGTAPWLEKMIKASEAFIDDYSNDYTDTGNYIYIAVEEYTVKGVKSNRMLFAYGDKPANTSSRTWTAYDQLAYYNFMTSADEDNSRAEFKIKQDALYLGSQYSEAAGSTLDYVVITPTFSLAADANDETKIETCHNFLNLLQTKLESLASDARFQETVETTEYQNPTLAKELQGYITADVVTIIQQNRLINGWNSGSSDWVADSDVIVGYKEKIKAIEDGEDGKKGLTKLEDELTTLKETTIPTQKQAVEDAETAYQTEVTDVENGVEPAQNAYNASVRARATASLAVETAKNNLANAQKTANDAVLSANYQSVTLTSNETVETMIKGTYTGTIKGGGNVITVNCPSAFDIFNGTLSNVAIMGTWADGYDGGRYQNVAVWTGSKGRWHDNNSQTAAEDFNTLNELGFAARSSFGVNIAEQTLTKLSDATKVFGVKIYSTPGVTPSEWIYTNLQNGSFVNAPAVAENVFVESITADFGEIANVYSGTTCPKAVVTEGKPFYCPADLTATEVTYSRQNSDTNTSNMFAACLPFSIDPSKVTGARICTFDNESNNMFWFEFQENLIKANTPILIYGTSKNLTLNLEGVALAKTPDNQIVVGGRPENGNSQSLGNFASINAGNWLGSSQVANGRIFGLNKQGKFQVSAEGTTFAPFRMVIASDYTNEANATRQIRIVNRLGVDITDQFTGQASGVEDIDAASSLSIVGGQGAIEFTADADYGKVEIYNVNGGLVTVANVMTGTTSVNVEKGIYIVMGKKVMVK